MCHIFAIVSFFKGFARVARAVVGEHDDDYDDDSTLSRHRRDLTELEEEDKPKARSKVIFTVTVQGKM